MRESIAEIFCVFVMIVVSFLVLYYGRDGGIRTHTVMVLSHLPPSVGLHPVVAGTVFMTH